MMGLKNHHVATSTVVIGKYLLKLESESLLRKKISV